MKTYMLSHGDEEAGPYAFDQVHSMWHSGQVNGEALVCENDGRRRWVPLADFLRPVAPVQRGGGGGLSAVAIIVTGLVVLLVILVGTAVQDTPVSKDAALLVGAKRWVRENLADRDAEVMGAGEVHSYEGKQYRVVRVRGKNAFGGPVVNDFIARTSPDGGVFWMTKPKEFFSIRMQEVSRGKGETWGPEELKVRAFMQEMGFSREAYDD